MAKGISISIAADTKDAQRGIKAGLIEPLQDTEKALTNLERASPEVRAALEKTFRGAQRETKDLRKEYDKLGDEIRKTGRRGRDFGDDIEHGTDKASEGLGEFKDEANSTAREAAASFDGSAESIGDAFQEVAANAFSGFGPAGAAAGIAAAIGLGVIFSTIQQGTEEAEQRFSDMYDDMLESGQRFLSESFVQDAIGELGRDTGKFNEALATSKELGVSVQTVLRAMVGDQDAINSVIDATNAKRDEEIAKLDAQADGSAAVADRQDAINLKADETVRKFQAISAETDTAADRAAAVAAAYGTGVKKLDEQVRKIQDMAAKLNGIGDKTVKINADTTGLEGALRDLQGRTISVNVEGQITRIGNQVW